MIDIRQPEWVGSVLAFLIGLSVVVRVEIFVFVRFAECLGGRSLGLPVTHKYTKLQIYQPVHF